MGNTPPSPDCGISRREKELQKGHDSTANTAQQMVQGVQKSLKDTIQNFDADSSVFDKMCGPMFDNDDKIRPQRSDDSEDLSEDDSRTVSEDDTYHKDPDNRRKGRFEDASVFSQSDYESGTDAGRSTRSAETFETEEDSYAQSKNRRERGGKTSVVSESKPSGLSKPLASSFAKRCYFTKAGIGKSTQHYEGLTLTGNIVLMLAAAMKLKGCPTICDEDLRRVEQTYPNQFSRLPDELLLSSGWRRISKYCHFSNKPIPDGVPFFHSKERLHPSGGFYFLLAAAVGMIRPLDVEPLTRDTLVLLETDYPNQCDAAPCQLKEDADEWMLVDKFCFFSGGPINTEEDVYYMADFDGNPIFMLAFLSPSLTPDELYKLTGNSSDEPGLKSVAAVEDVESVYDLTERDFDDLKLYHLGPCRALPPHILQPQAWTKVLPPHFLAAKHRAMEFAQNWVEEHRIFASRPEVHDEIVDQYSDSPEINSTQGGIPTNYIQPEYDSVAREYTDDGNAENFNDVDEDGYAFNVAPAMVPGSFSDGNSFSPSSGIVSPGVTQEPVAFYGPSEEEATFSTFGDAMDRTVTQDSQQLSSEEYSSPVQAPPTTTEPFLSHAYSSMPASQQDDRFDSYYEQQTSQQQHNSTAPISDQVPSDTESEFQREVEEEGAFGDPSVPIDEAIANRKMMHSPPPCDERNAISPEGYRMSDDNFKMDPPDDEPPSLSRDEADDEISVEEAHEKASYYPSLENESEEMVPPDMTPATMSEFNEDDPDYYDSPEKESQRSGSVEYYSREEEYYDSPEQRTNPSNMDEYTDEESGNPQFTPVSNDSEFFNEDNRKRDPSCASKSSSPLTQCTTPQSTPQETPEREFRGSPQDESAYISEESTSPHNELSPNSDLVSASEHSRSAALRSAQDLLRKSRERRVDKAHDYNNKLNIQPTNIPEHDFEYHDTSHNGTPVSNNGKSQQTRGSHEEEKKSGSPSSAWESSSEMTSVISGSSVWTDSSNAADRSSRRALILQMAKARMKQHKSSASVSESKASTTRTIAEEASSERTVSNAEFDMTKELD
mmetsp:Transcript_13459/g.19834  ORF Transcript_13459/g.19834 Transcript_13459/m.19834 type:complete len:1058 (+) Transcript_13459:208-3381(+)|eukprot:CAMPEP_0194203470 /NCGR_PEP_ID=MMETSP0156-20130528/3231_1 /TAXON_ID=33649 /ORGANISM="Thalassionema nitzschioides, Strain L26-B" /LENGTH=1057 /DNA_ID=CAMNT_0038929223 /DNA_START=121 /DNA_END=3294 /DNA_ORIENTATION=-